MKIFAIIVTYNAMRRGWIDRCLQSLQVSSLPVTIIVVDNLSTDGTREHVPNCYPDAVWLPQDKNLGFGQANNVGIRYALEHDADYVLLLNQDATIKEDALERMCSVCDGKSIVSPVQLNGDGTRLDTLFKYVLLQADHLLFDDLLVHGVAKESYINGQYAAACWLMPIAVIKEVGGFNPLFFHYSEDYNYLSRARFHHFKTMLAIHAFMCHDRNQHGNNKVFAKKELHREMLLATSDINNSFFRCIFLWSKNLLRCYSYCLPRRQYVPGTFLMELIWFLFHSRTILKSRSIEKKQGPSWLYN